MLKGVSIYTIAGFLGAGINFLVMPLISHYLLPAEYGILSVFNTYVSILVPLVGIMAIGLLNVEYYKIKNKQKFASLFSSIQVIPILPAILFIGVVAFLPDSVTTWLMMPKGVGKIWIYLAVVISLLTVYTESFLSLFIIQKKPASFAAANLLKVAFEVLMTLFLVIYCKMGWKGRVLSWFITASVYTIIALFYFYKRGLLTLNIKTHYIIRGVTFGAPLILHAIGGMVINQSDRIFIAKYVSISEAGIYGMGYLFGTVILIASNAFNYFYIPFIYERLGTLDSLKELQIVKLGYITFIIMGIVLMLTTAVAPFIFKYLIDYQYVSGIKFVFLTGLSYFFWSVFCFFSAFVYFRKKNNWLAVLSIVNILLNIVFNFMFIPKFGAIGACYATSISFFINAAIIIVISSSLYKLPWFNFRKIIKTSF